MNRIPRTKDEIERREGAVREGRYIRTVQDCPAINVKDRHDYWYGSEGPYVERIARDFNVDTRVAEKAFSRAYDRHIENFWNSFDPDYQDESTFVYIFGEYDPQVFSDGRSGGWLVVSGLPDVDDWDAVMLARWRRAVKEVYQEMAYWQSYEAFLETIEEGDYCTPKPLRYLREVA